MPKAVPVAVMASASAMVAGFFSYWSKERKKKMAEPSAPTYVVFAGGGPRALHAYMGIVDALEDHCGDWRARVRGVAGTSAGALAALAVLLSVPRASRHVMTEKSSDLMAHRPNVGSFLTQYAMDDGATVRAIIAEMLSIGGLSQTSTLGDMARLLRVRFVCVAACARTGRSVHLSSDTFPEMRVVDAVYASCAVPFVFSPLAYKDFLFIDGGVLENVPYVFEDVDAGEVFRVRIARPSAPRRIDDFPSFVGSLVSLMMLQGNDEAVQRRLGVVTLPAQKLGEHAMNVGEHVAHRLYDLGYAHMVDRLHGGRVREAVTLLARAVSAASAPDGGA